MECRKLGDRTVSAIGLGAMPLSVEDHPPREQAVRTIHAALDGGISLIDTADAYCTGADEVGHNERLVAAAVRGWSGDRDTVVIATKGGHTRQGDGSWGLNGSPAYLRRACDASLRALGTDVIDLYQFHRPDPGVPLVESVGALADLRHEGKVRMVGVSNFDVDGIKDAQSVVPIVSVQNEYSPAFRSSRAEIDYCDAHGIAFLAWSPLGGMSAAHNLASRHPAFAAVADECGASPQQVALAWELSQAPNVIPIPGASRPDSILDSIRAADLHLTDAQRSRLDHS
ncbi:MAG: aldo/keto reductase [Nitriliruptorales bacterium]|nr:aldo/keto reductase [Nitriliruptorales bacterium]